MGMATKVDREYKPGLIYIPGKINVKVFLAWYDFWVGFYYDREFKELYVCPFPCIVFKFYRVTTVVEDEDFTIELSDILKSKADSGR